MNKLMRKIEAIFLALVCIVMGIVLTACGRDTASEDETEEPQKDRIVIGFSQLGAESDWRAANTESMKTVFSQENGYELIFEDAQQKQSNQITSVRNFIQQEVDYIVIAPVTETGWDTVLKEAKDAGIPVIIVDRRVDVSDEDLFTCWVGSDFELEGRKMAEWLNAFSVNRNIAPENIHIANIQGTIGATAQIGRSQGLRDGATKYGWDFLAEVPGEFTKAMGYEAMEGLLRDYPSINVVYCENDNEAFGAIEAITAAGRNVGSDIAGGDIMILSFDGVKEEALSDVIEGKIACIGECNPLHGPRVESIISMLELGKHPQKYTFVDEEIFSSDSDIPTLLIDNKVYNVVTLTPEYVAERAKLFNVGSYNSTNQSPDAY